ncbi:acetyl-CoA synthetase-like protein [Hortaea werneckii]|nr:acetyl-CoA synthetase-like protein [Hortaea werneckii]
MPFLAESHVPIPNQDILSWTFDNYKHDWNDPIYIDALDPKNSISAHQAKRMIRQLVAGFNALGIKRDDCVCIHSFNSIYYPMFFLGIVAAGGVFAGTNPAYTPYELAHTLHTAKVKKILVAPELMEPVLKAVEQTEGMSNNDVIVFNPNGESAPSGFMGWADLLKHGEQDWMRFDDLETAKDKEAARLFSSGTTGLPKAASLSHRNFIAQHTLVFESQKYPWRSSRLHALPMFHAATSPAAFVSPLRASEKAYVMPRFDLEKWFWAAEKYQITDITLVPPIVILAISSPLNQKYSLKQCKAARGGAAPLDKGPQKRMQALMGGAPFTQVWGMTETSCVCSMFNWDEYDETGSVGRMVANMDAKLVDDAGKDISGFDVRGELCVRGPLTVKGYFENPEANARDWDADGYFHTGDIAFRDGKSKLWYIVDRKKELIKVRGFQVAPPELEGVLLGHPDIVDVAVIGITDSAHEGSELPRAYVQRRPGSGGKPSAEDVQVYMRERLASYKALTGGVVFIDAIPKNQSGKILKRILREQAKKETGAKL